ncbi:hypothetical protein, partial [Aeromonas caviae]|uniref:hypothetical protein n=1 Tax=Aeromonas caviae TaxID=648 RepID=UPI002B46377E
PSPQLVPFKLHRFGQQRPFSLYPENNALVSIAFPTSRASKITTAWDFNSLHSAINLIEEG